LGAFLTASDKVIFVAVQTQNLLYTSLPHRDSPNWLYPSILAFNLLSTLRDLIINPLNLQSETELTGTFLIPLEQGSSSLLEVFTLSLPNAGAGRH
jgi:hypothetical protein